MPAPVPDTRRHSLVVWYSIRSEATPRHATPRHATPPSRDDEARHTGAGNPISLTDRPRRLSMSIARNSRLMEVFTRTLATTTGHWPDAWSRCLGWAAGLLGTRAATRRDSLRDRPPPLLLPTRSCETAGPGGTRQAPPRRAAQAAESMRSAGGVQSRYHARCATMNSRKPVGARLRSS